MNPIRRFYREILQQNKIAQFVVLLSFLITFIIVRIIVYLQRIGYLPNQMGPIHIHHMVPGIILILITGYIGISFWNHFKTRITTALFFGIGAALTIDEFALWLFLRDVYWEREGRISVDAIVITASVLLFIALFYNVRKEHKRRH